MGQDTITFKCSCGSTKFEMPKNPKPSDIVKCIKCGASSKHGELMKEATRLAKAAIDKKMREVFKK